MTDKNPTTKPAQGDLLGDPTDPKKLAEALEARMKGKRPAPPVVEKPKKERSLLAPVRHPNMDFFVCDVLDAVPKEGSAHETENIAR
jgi:hypothetical protein